MPFRADEIRNPLTSIKNFIELIPDHFEDEDFRKSLLFHIPKQIDYINTLVGNLLEYSKPKAGFIEKIMIKQLIQDEIIPSFFKQNIDRKGTECKIDISDDFIIEADKNQIMQVFVNLIQNAFDSIKGKGCLNVYTKENQKEKVIIIEDNGIKIPDEYITKVFDPFFTTKRRGTGLGLFICYQLMKENNGVIELTNIENGSRVSLTFKKERRKTNGKNINN